jgi:hypothetical protein
VRITRTIAILLSHELTNVSLLGYHPECCCTRHEDGPACPSRRKPLAQFPALSASLIILKSEGLGATTIVVSGGSPALARIAITAALCGMADAYL